MDVRYHWIQVVLNEKLLQLVKIHIDENESNMMIKSLFKKKHDFCRSKERGWWSPPPPKLGWGDLLGIPP